MNKNKGESPLDGFGSIIDNIVPATHENDVANLDTDETSTENPDSVIDLNLSQDKKDPEEDKDNTDDTIEDKDKSKDNKSKTDQLDFKDEPGGEESTDDNTDDEPDNTDTDKGEGDDDNSESAGVSQFFDAFSEALGWDVEDENKPNTVDELIDYVKELVEENSQPDYSDNRVKELDEYLKNGGKFEDFYGLQSKETSYENVDLDDVDNQKSIIKDYLQMSGFNDEQIKRKIDRFEEAGMLQDEASDNLELLKEYKKNEKEQLLEEQRAQQEEYENKQKTLIQEITSNINNLTEVRGINVPAEDRKKLLDYAFKTDANGRTQFQKDYAKNATKNFIETAYFSMKGDALLKSAKHSGESSAVNKLKQTLKTSTKYNRTNNNMNNQFAKPVWTAASSLFGGR